MPVVQGVQAWDRYAYVNNNPVLWNDPSGHKVENIEGGDGNCKHSSNCVYPEGYANSGKLIGSRRTENNNPSREKETADTLSYVILGLDAAATLLSDIEAITVDVTAASIIVPGCATIERCLPAIALAYGVDYGVTTISPLGSIENALGVFSLGLTGISDGLLGNNSLSDDGLHMGRDTIVAARNMIAGFVPESNIDAIVSNSQLKYDLDRLLGNKPGGSILIHNPQDLFSQVLFQDWW